MVFWIEPNHTLSRIRSGRFGKVMVCGKFANVTSGKRNGRIQEAPAPPIRRAGMRDSGRTFPFVHLIDCPIWYQAGLKSARFSHRPAHYEAPARAAVLPPNVR